MNEQFEGIDPKDAQRELLEGIFANLLENRTDNPLSKDAAKKYANKFAESCINSKFLEHSAANIITDNILHIDQRLDDTRQQSAQELLQGISDELGVTSQYTIPKNLDSQNVDYEHQGRRFARSLKYELERQNRQPKTRIK